MKRLVFVSGLLVLFASLAVGRPTQLSDSASSLRVEDLSKLSKEELITLLLAANGQVLNDGSVVSPTSDEAMAQAKTYWWKYPNQDCGSDDLTYSCRGQSVETCEKMCNRLADCGGFNTHGYLKKLDCIQKKGDCIGCGVDLYVKRNTPQPTGPAWLLAWPPVWPHPASYQNGSNVATVAPLMKVTYTSSSNLVTDAVSRFFARTFTHQVPAIPSSAIMSLSISVVNASAPLQLEADESYSLEINDASQKIQIHAATQVGVMHALETLSQLIRFDFDTQSFVIRGAPWWIQDAPRFKHRELLIDSSRHFQPVSSIKQILESMTYAKVNVLHWHLVDHQSFPFDSPSRPLLSKYGAFSPQERYTPSDVEEVIAFATARGIRVVVEIDNPGHAISWCAGYPQICPSTTCLQPLNPVHNLTFEVIEDLLRDLTGGKRGKGLFYDNFLHLGGDEVDMSCWDETPEIAAWMKSKNMTTEQTYFYFVAKAQAIGHKMGRDVVGWEEIFRAFGTSLDKSTVIHVWLDAATTKDCVAAGYRTLYSPYQLWYLDYLSLDWLKMYSVEPCDGIPDAACSKLLLGGGGEMWGETVDISDIQQTIWPRLGAIAERLWSPRSVTDEVMAQERLLSFRCLLNQRGVPAAPVMNSQGRTAPPGPASCFAQ